MSGEIWAQIDADAKNVAMHQTWGHLFPEKDYYEGVVRLAPTLYNSVAILNEGETLPCSSPWWYNAITDFAFDEAEEMKVGEVADVTIAVRIVQHKEDLTAEEIEECGEPKTWETIEITTLKRVVLIPGC